MLAAAIPSHMCGQLRHESVIDVLLHQIRAQGRVVKQEPAHDHAAKIEVDMFKHRSRQALLEILAHGVKSGHATQLFRLKRHKP